MQLYRLSVSLCKYRWQTLKVSSKKEEAAGCFRHQRQRKLEFFLSRHWSAISLAWMFQHQWQRKLEFFPSRHWSAISLAWMFRHQRQRKLEFFPFPTLIDNLSLLDVSTPEAEKAWIFSFSRHWSTTFLAAPPKACAGCPACPTCRRPGASCAPPTTPAGPSSCAGEGEGSGGPTTTAGSSSRDTRASGRRYRRSILSTGRRRLFSRQDAPTAQTASAGDSQLSACLCYGGYAIATSCPESQALRCNLSQLYLNIRIFGKEHYVSNELPEPLFQNAHRKPVLERQFRSHLTRSLSNEWVKSDLKCLKNWLPCQRWSQIFRCLLTTSIYIFAPTFFRITRSMDFESKRPPLRVGVIHLISVFCTIDQERKVPSPIICLWLLEVTSMHIVPYSR